MPTMVDGMVNAHLHVPSIASTLVLNRSMFSTWQNYFHIRTEGQGHGALMPASSNLNACTQHSHSHTWARYFHCPTIPLHPIKLLPISLQTNGSISPFFFTIPNKHADSWWRKTQRTKHLHRITYSPRICLPCFLCVAHLCNRHLNESFFHPNCLLFFLYSDAGLCEDAHESTCTVHAKRRRSSPFSLLLCLLNLDKAMHSNHLLAPLFFLLVSYSSF